MKDSSDARGAGRHALPHFPDSGDADASHTGGAGEPSTGMARWMKALGFIAIALLLFLFIFLHLSGAIGPGLHAPPPSTPSPSVTTQDVRQP